jgi:hypothetical protein
VHTLGSFFENIRKAEAEGSLILEIFRKPKLEGFVILIQYTNLQELSVPKS